jgi:hypothetical protein
MSSVYRAVSRMPSSFGMIVDPRLVAVDSVAR